MNAPPPPPPVPPAPGTVQAWDRRALRDQRRMAARAIREQRSLQRMQMRAMRRNSIVGPLMLIGTGLLFLVVEMGSLPADALFAWLARWWPTLLLGAGLVMLGEWAVDTWFGSPQQGAVPRRTLGPLGILLLVLLTVAGISAMGVHRSSDWMRQNLNADVADAWGLDQIFAHQSETDQELTARLSAGSVLTVQNYQGAINITGSSPDGQVHVSVHRRLLGWSSDDLRARERRDTARLESNGSGLLLKVPGQGRDRADLTIEVPHQSALDLSPEKGNITVSEVRGPLSIGAHHGNIALTALTGHILLNLHDDNASVTGHSLSGDLVLQGRSGDLAFSDVAGPVTLHGDFFGTTHLERIKGPVHFQSSFTDLTCTGIPGELNVEGRSELQAKDLDGPVVLSTSDRNLTLDGIRQGANITDRNGSVTLTLGEPLGPVSVSTTDAAVDLRVPEKAGFHLAAETVDGQVNNDLGLTALQRNDHTTLEGQVRKGGPEITLHTSNGDISIHKAAKVIATDNTASSTDTDD